MKKILTLLLALCLLLSACGSEPAATTAAPETTAAETEPAPTEPAVRTDVPTDGEGWYLWDENGEVDRENRSASGTNAAVATSKVEASLAGEAVLQAGGNAVDAAIAAAFALSVVESNSSGIGGGGFMLIHTADGTNIFINFREKAPAAATIDNFTLDEQGFVSSVEVNKGGKSVCIPGEVAGLWYAYENYGSGKVTWAELIAPAIELAEEGYVVTATLSEAISENYEAILNDPELNEMLLLDGFYPEAGERLTNAKYAETLRKLAEGGRDAFYTGEIAQAIVDSVQAAGGFMTLEDLAGYEVSVSEPATGTYRGYQIISSPLPSSGGTHVIEALNLLENFDIASSGSNTVTTLHLMAESFKQVFKDRAAYMGDPAYVQVPADGLTSKEYAAAIASQFSEDSIVDYSDVDPWNYEHTDTTHFSVADAEGNMVAVTQTINLDFGSRVGVSGCGFVLNDEMKDFSTDPSSPNAIAPGKTPLSSMSPTVVLNEDGTPFMVLGSPGSTRIITTVTQVISNVIDHGMTIQEAINTPRIYIDTNGVLGYENRLDEEVVKALEAMGYTTEEQDPYYHSYGALQAVLYDEDGTLQGGADPRRDGKAVAY